jgi:hypothetical protein
MGFVIGLNSIALGAFLTDPLLVIAMLPPEMLLYPNKITQRVAWIVVQAARLRANENPLLHHRILPLQQLPRHLVPPPMHLKVLVSLKPLVADLAHITIGFQ